MGKHSSFSYVDFIGMPEGREGISTAKGAKGLREKGWIRFKIYAWEDSRLKCSVARESCHVSLPVLI